MASKSQVAVIGLGRFGFSIARRFHELDHEVLAIDIEPDNVERVKEHCSRAVVLDGRDTERLRALGIRDFDIVVISLGELIDASTLIALRLKELGVGRLVTKAGSEDHAKLLRLIGVEDIVFPEREAADRLVRRLTCENVLDFIPLGEEHSVHEMAAPEEFVGRTLAELRLRNRYDVQVLGVRDVLTQKLHLNPGPDFRVKESDALLVIGTNESLNNLPRR